MKKIPLILLAGLLSDEEVWRHQIVNLKDIADITVPDFAKANNTQALLDVVMQGAPQKFALAGHSMGGWVALEVALNYPERITKLCLLNTTAKSDSVEKAARRRAMLQQVAEEDSTHLIDQIANSFISTRDPQVHSQIKRMFLRNMASFISQQTAMLQRRDCVPLLASIKLPTLIIHAAKDKNFSLADSKTLMQIPNSKLAIVEDAGHMAPMEIPQAVTALMRYWLMYF